jgi:O-antigen/teichoic acid export membrane protein
MNIDPPAEGSHAAEARAAAPSDGGERAIRGGAIRVIGYVAGVLVSLGAAAILLRHLGVSNFGRYVTVTSLIAVVGGVTEAGISLYGIREFASRTEPARSELMANLMGMRLALTAVGVVLAVGFALAVGYGHVLVLGAAVVGCGLAVQVMCDVLSIPLQAQLRLARLTAVDFSRRVAAVGLIAALALAGAALLPFFAVSVASGVIALALLAWLVRPPSALVASLDWRVWRELLRETLPYAIAMSIGAIYFYVTVIVMSLIASGTQTGLFATSFRVTQVALGIPILLLTAIFPLLSHEGADLRRGGGEMVGKVFQVAVICGVWMTLVMALGAGLVIPALAGSRADGAIAVLRIQSAVLTMSFVSASSALVLISLRRFRAMIFTSSGALALNIILGLALIPTLGARGGALADVITESLVALGLTTILIGELPRRSIRPSVIWPVLPAGGLSAAVVLLPIGSIAHVVAATIIYFGILLLTGNLPSALTGVLRAGLRRT